VRFVESGAIANADMYNLLYSPYRNGVLAMIIVHG
jgi:hypothetical protein